MLAVSQDCAQLAPAPIPGADNLSERDGVAGQVGTDSPAQKLLLVKDPNLAHVARIEPERH